MARPNKDVTLSAARGRAVDCGEMRRVLLYAGPESAELGHLRGWAERKAMAVSTTRLDTSIDSFAAGVAALLAINGSQAMMLAVAEGARFRAEQPRTPLLFLGPGGAEHASAALRAGATVFLATPAQAMELDEAAERCTHRDRPGSLEGTHVLELCPGVVLDLRAHCLWVEGRERPLTHTKFELLAYLLENPGRAIGLEELTRARILTRSQATRLKGIISELRNAIGSAKDTIRCVPGYGYRFDPVRASAPPSQPNGKTQR